MKLILKSCETAEDLVRSGTDLLSFTIRASIAERGRCIIGLSGGNTPRPIYEALGKEKDIDWSKVWIFLVDDRHIRADSPHSNQFLLRSTLLAHAPVPDSQVIMPDTTLPLADCVALYDRHIADLVKNNPPDIVTLGMGDDGHIASLFPPVSNDAFGKKSVIHTITDKFTIKDRISVTLPVLMKSRQAVFFLQGKKKLKIWEEMMASADDEHRWPAKAVLAACETTILFG